jgi:hypothetical protein
MRQIQIIRHNNGISGAKGGAFGGGDGILGFVFIEHFNVGPVGGAAGVAEEHFAVLAQNNCLRVRPAGWGWLF